MHWHLEGCLLLCVCVCCVHVLCIHFDFYAMVSYLYCFFVYRITSRTALGLARWVLSLSYLVQPVPS